MQTIDRQAVIRALQKFNNGAGVILVSEFARFLGVSDRCAKKKLAGLPAYEGKFYLVSDVADLLIRGMEGGTL